jgi:hypothetical protein
MKTAVQDPGVSGGGASGAAGRGDGLSRASNEPETVWSEELSCPAVPTPAPVTVSAKEAVPSEAAKAPAQALAADQYPSVVQFRVLGKLMQDPAFAETIAQVVHNAYQQQVPGGATTPMLPADIDPSRKLQLIAQNLAPFYALDSLITNMWRERKWSPVQTLKSLTASELSAEGITTPGLLANLAWKAGQPFRGIGRIERPVFAPFPLLENKELAKDHPLMKAVAQSVLGEIDKHLANLYPKEIEERLFARTEGVLEKFKNLAECKGVTYREEEYAALRKTARDVMFTHAKQYRNHGEPYYSHLLDVAEVLIDVFKVTDIRLLHVALRHDYREDQSNDYSLQRAYRRNKLERDAKDPSVSGDLIKKKREDLYHELLGVRMLSKVEKDEVPAYAANSSKRGAALTYDQIANPRAYFTDPNKPYSDLFIAGVQTVKLADILANTADLGGVLIPRADFTPDEKHLGFPQKFMEKVLHKAIPLFVGASPYLPEAVKKVFFDELQTRLRKEFIDPTHPKSDGHAAFKDVLEREGGLLSLLSSQASDY